MCFISDKGGNFRGKIQKAKYEETKTPYTLVDSTRALSSVLVDLVKSKEIGVLFEPSYPPGNFSYLPFPIHFLNDFGLFEK